jgi:hypothetical protein
MCGLKDGFARGFGMRNGGSSSSESELLNGWAGAEENMESEVKVEKHSIGISPLSIFF